MRLSDALEQLEVDVVDVCTEGDVETLARLHVQLAEDKHRLALCSRAVEERLAEVMPKRVELDGLPVIERRQGATRKQWQSEDLLDLLLRRASFDDDGTLRDSTEIRDRVRAELVACVPFTGSLGWRVTALKERDIDPDEWCESQPGRVSVQIHEDPTTWAGAA